MPACRIGRRSSLTLALAFVCGVLIERVIIRPVENSPVLAVVIVFIGLLVIFNSLAGWIFTYTVKPFPSPFPPSRCSATIRFARTTSAQIGVTLVVLALLFVFFRFTPLGLAMRAAAQNPVSSRLVGIRVGWMLALGWGLAGAFGAIAGMMVAPTVYPRSEHDGGHLALCVCRRAARRHRQPGGRGRRRLHGRRAGESGRRYLIGNELKLTVALVLIVGVLVVRPSGLFGRVTSRG